MRRLLIARLQASVPGITPPPPPPAPPPPPPPPPAPPPPGSGRVMYQGDQVTHQGEPLTHSFGTADMELLAVLQGLSDAGASGASAGVLGFQGSALVKFQPPSLGNAAIYPLSVGQQTLTAAMLRGGVLEANATTGGVVLNIPLLAAIPYTIDSAHPTRPYFHYRRTGAASLAINPLSGVYINWQKDSLGDNALYDPQYMGAPDGRIYTLTFRALMADGPQAGKEWWDAS